MRVVADTGPLQYLILLGQIGLLPALFTGVTVPTEVCAELLDLAAPDPVRRWAANPPPWLVIASAPSPDDPRLGRLGAGEAAAISLALSLQANLVLMDDRAGVVAARAKGLDVIGTVDILDRAASRRLIDIVEAVERRKATNFRIRPALLNGLLAGHRGDAP